jgi:hypothetical protein
MVDDYLTASATEPLEPAGPAKKGVAGFASTKRGRLVLGGLALLTLVIVVGVALTVFAFPTSDTATDPLAPPAGALAGNATVVPASDAETATAPSTEPLSNTFAFRDIFVPTIKPDVAPASTDTSGTTADTTGDGDTGNTVPPNTLQLESVSTVDGEAVATFTWNGQEYTAGEGDQLGDSPWQVVSIEGDTVVMLYGDNRVSLTVGQGITK